MKLKYIIFTFKTKEERTDMLNDWVWRFQSYLHREELLDKAGNIDVDSNNTLSKEFTPRNKFVNFIKV